MAALTILLRENWALRLVTAVKILFVVVFEVTAHISASSAFFGIFLLRNESIGTQKAYSS